MLKSDRHEALQALRNDWVYGVSISKDSLHSLLLECSRSNDVAGGRKLYSLMLHTGMDSDARLSEHLIRLFIACGSLLEANIVFANIAIPTVYTWHFISSGYASLGEYQKAIQIFHKMQNDDIQPDKVMFLDILRTCGMLGVLEQGKNIHKQVLQSGLASDLAIGSTLVDMYAKCGDLEEAVDVFEKLPYKNVVTWNAMMSGYMQRDDAVSCLKLFERMKKGGVKPDRITFLCLLRAYALVKDVDNGHWLHNHVIIIGQDLDESIGTTLVSMYAKLERLEEAHTVFDNLPNRNEMPWNALIMAYAQQGNDNLAFEMFEKMSQDGVAQDITTWSSLIVGLAQQGEGLLALSVFERMQREGVRPEKVTYLCALKACMDADAIVSGKHIHDLIIRDGFEYDMSIGNTLIDMYAYCGILEEACAIFDCMTSRSTVSWNVMLDGYARHEQGYRALKLFRKLQHEGVKFDCFTLSSVLTACAMVGALGQGEVIHSMIFEFNFELNLVLGSGLVRLYARCGSMRDAEKVFAELQNRDMACWNALIAGYSQHALWESALQCLDNMKQEGMRPAARTYTNVLTACSHSGQVLQGWHLMKEIGDIIPDIEHFHAIINLLGHCGCLSEAKELLHSIHLSPTVTCWMSLLFCCRVYSNKELGEECLSQALRLDSCVAAGYVIMADIYASLNMWEDAIKLLKLSKYGDVQKKLGTAWIEVNHSVHEFVVGIDTHPQVRQINTKWKHMRVLLQSTGYVPQAPLVIEPGLGLGRNDISYGHRERPAIQLGLLSTIEGATVRVTFEHQSFIHRHNLIKTAHKIRRRSIFLLSKSFFLKF